MNKGTLEMAVFVHLAVCGLFIWAFFLLIRKAVKDGILRAVKVIRKEGGVDYLLELINILREKKNAEKILYLNEEGLPRRNI